MKNKFVGFALLVILTTYPVIAKGGLGGVFGSLVGGAVGKTIGQSIAGKNLTVEQGLVKLCEEQNKNFPIMSDAGTRVDNMTAGPGKRLTYNCTFITLNGADIDSVNFISKMTKITTVRFKTPVNRADC